MSSCPVCDHAQPAGDVCDVCGWRLTGPGVTPIPVAPVEGLEPTVLAGTDTPPPQLVEGLEHTGAPPVAAPPPEPSPWLEVTLFGQVAAPPAAPEPGLEVERFETPERLPEPDPFDAPLCRYCRTPGTPGDVFCARCGMRIGAPVIRAGDADVDAPLPRCRVCGAAGRGSACPMCGTPFQASEEG